MSCLNFAQVFFSWMIEKNTHELAPANRVLKIELKSTTLILP